MPSFWGSLRMKKPPLTSSTLNFQWSPFVFVFKQLFCAFSFSIPFALDALFGALVTPWKPKYWLVTPIHACFISVSGQQLLVSTTEWILLKQNLSLLHTYIKYFSARNIRCLVNKCDWEIDRGNKKRQDSHYRFISMLIANLASQNHWSSQLFSLLPESCNNPCWEEQSSLMTSRPPWVILGRRLLCVYSYHCLHHPSLWFQLVPGITQHLLDRWSSDIS